MSDFFAKTVKNENGNITAFEIGDAMYDVETIFEAVNLFESEMWRSFVFATDDAQDKANAYWDIFDESYDRDNKTDTINHFDRLLEAAKMRYLAEGRQTAFREMLRQRVSYSTFDVAIKLAETCSCRFF